MRSISSRLRPVRPGSLCPSIGSARLGLFAASGIALALAGASDASAAPAPQTTRVIVVLANQNTGLAVGSAARAAAVAAEQAPIVAQLRASGATGISSTSLVNALTATVSPGEATALAANSAVAAVDPDATVAGPPPPATPVSPLSASPALAPVTPAVTPSSRTAPACGTSTAPELDPEALGNIKATQAQALGINGAGVKVAFLADGFDPNNPDFRRNSAYASTGSPAGSAVITDYEDFSGDGTAAPTAGAEAFGDASSIAAQGNQVYDLSKFVNTAHPLPAGCDIKIVGVAPGASVLGLKIFGQNDFSSDSGILQAIEYAVSSGAKVINESFGNDPFPDTSLDLVREANDAAVAAGVTVVVSSGDSGITSTIGSPATDPNVISVGATTTLRAYAQESYGGINDPNANGRVVDDNIGSISSGGFTQAGGTLDLVAPGDDGWALCDANVAMFSECTDFNDKPATIQPFGGTSQSAPFTSGAAADVIQAYARTHGGVDPTPAVVKQILTSTATDIDAPAVQQGAGLLNVLGAVQDAESIAPTSVTPTGGVVVGPTQIDVAQRPGATSTQAISVTNTSASPVKVNLSTRALTKQVSDQTGSFCLQTGTPTTSCPANTGTFPIWTGLTDVYQDVPFTVPAGTSRLRFAADFPPPPDADDFNSLVRFALLEPDGTYAGYSRPQGLADYGELEVANPPGGKWTAVFFTERNGAAPGAVGTTGPIAWDASSQDYAPASPIFPATLQIAAGKSASATLAVTSPSAPGDTDQSVVVSTPGNQTTIPVTVRTLVPTGLLAGNGAFSGVLTGGNGRDPSDAAANTYFFDVPPGQRDLDASVTLANDPNDTLVAYLVDPNGQTVGYSTNLTTDASLNPLPTRFVNLYHVAPATGRWSLVLQWENPVSGSELAEPFTGQVRFNQVNVTANLPGGGLLTALAPILTPRIAAGTTSTYTVKVRNTGTAPEAFFVDPRLGTSQTMVLPDLSGENGSVALPLPAEPNTPVYAVPTHTTQLQASETATRPVTFELTYFPGDPAISSAIATPSTPASQSGGSASLSLNESEVSPGLWAVIPGEIGPFPVGGEPPATATGTVSAVTQAFDPTIDSSTGDFWTAINGLTPDFSPVYVAPGATGQITVALTPTAAPGTHVSGTLYVNDYALASTFDAANNDGDEVAALPYNYIVAAPHR
ncbi:MAG TPA: S8 family serine peptidase [Solirubrobacteraceae bacterium]|nr:S8 family serine peptidase [Solirubrobacteraceae bacterium]